MQDLRPEIPRDTHPKLVELLHRCWHKDPSLRPEFSEILKFLHHINNMIAGKKKKVKVKAQGIHEHDKIQSLAMMKLEDTCTYVEKRT